MKTESMTVSIFIRIIILLLATASFGCFFLQYIFPYESLSQKLLGYSYTGDIEFFTYEYYEGCISRARILGVGLLVVVCGGVVFWTKISRYCHMFWMRKYAHTKQLWNWLKGSESQGRWETMAFWIILIIGIMIRSVYLHQDVHADEARTFTAYAYRPFFIILSDWTAPNNQIFHTLLVRFCYLLMGKSLIVLRTPAFVCGVLFLPLIYLWVRKCFGSVTGLLTMSFCATNYGIVGFSVVGRGYTILFCCIYMLLLIALAIRRYPHNPLTWLLAVFVSVIGMFTIPTMLFTVLGVISWLFVLGAYRRYQGERNLLRGGSLVCLITIGVFTVLLYAPAFIATDWQLVQDDTTLTARRSLVNIMLTFPNWLRRLDSLAFSTIPIWGILIGAILGSIGFIGTGKEKAGVYTMIGCVTGVAILFPVLIQRVIPYARVYIAYIPAVVAVFIYGIVRLFRYAIPKKQIQQWIWCSTAIVGTFISGILLVNKYGYSCLPTGDHVKGIEIASKYLVEHAAAGDIVIASTPVPGPLIYYLDKDEKALRVYDLFQYIPILNEGTNTAWFLASEEHGQSISNMVEKVLEGAKNKDERYDDFGDISISKVHFGTVAEVVVTGW